MTTLNRKEQEILNLLTSNNLDVDKIKSLSSTLPEQDAKEVNFLLNVKMLNEQMKDKDKNIKAAEYFYYIDKNFSIIFLLYQLANPLHRIANEGFTSYVIFNSIVLFVFFAFLRFYYLEMKSFKQKNQFLFQ